MALPARFSDFLTLSESIKLNTFRLSLSHRKVRYFYVSLYTVV